MSHDTDIAIVGAGLSGLALGCLLRAEGRDVTILEARDRVGGRILSIAGHDLGPAWIWPHQSRMLALAARLGLSVFEQHSAGRLVFEDARGAIRRDLQMATMGGALRIAGGLGQVAAGLAGELGPAVRLGHAVQGLQETAQGVTLHGPGFSLSARWAVMALPPRLAAGLGVPVPDVPTWMAGHAKLLAVYDRPFWRAAGLNGDAVSHLGPLAEIHDASPASAEHGALFGFAVPGAASRPGFQAAALDQLARLFGAEAAQPRSVHIKDWSRDKATATDADQTPPSAHPRYLPIPSTRRVVFAGSETAPGEGGYLEGALEAAEAARDLLKGDAA